MLVNVLPQGNPLSSRTVLPLLTLVEAGFRGDASAFDRQRRALVRSIDRSPAAAIGSLVTVNVIAAGLVDDALPGRPGIAHILGHIREDWEGCCAMCDRVGPRVSACIADGAVTGLKSVSPVRQQILAGVPDRESVARVNAVITMGCVGWLAAELKAPQSTASRLLCESVIAYRPDRWAA